MVSRQLPERYRAKSTLKFLQLAPSVLGSALAKILQGAQAVQESRILLAACQESLASSHR